MRLFGRYSAFQETIRREDGSEVARAVDELCQSGPLDRDRDGRYYPVEPARLGISGIVGELYHGPNEGA